MHPALLLALDLRSTELYRVQAQFGGIGTKRE